MNVRNILKLTYSGMILTAMAMLICITPMHADAANITNGGNKMQSTEFTTIFPTGPKNDTYAQYFVGQSYLNMISLEQIVIGNVTFEPGCRNNWHIHHADKGGGQILLVTGGRGYYQDGQTSWFAHLALEVPGENSANEWLEPVNDADYNMLK